MRKLFVNGAQSEYGTELNCALERATGEKFYQHIDAFSYDYLVDNKIDVVISDGLSAASYSLLRGLNIPTITIGQLDKYSQYSDIVIDRLGLDDKRYFTGESSRIGGNDNFPIDRIANLITKLEWDSNFFGFNVAFLSCMHLTENIMHRIEQFLQRENIRLVEYLCNCHNAQSVRLAERYGFYFVDVRLTYARNFKRGLKLSCKQIEGLQIRESQPQDASFLAQIARNSYADSRYYFDRNFTLEQCQKFYEDWVLKSMKGEFDDIVFVALVDGKVAGFISCKHQSIDTGKIGLVGTSPEFQGKGVGKHLVAKSLEWFNAKKVSQVDVITQGRNYAAQRLYQSAGFRTKTVQLWYHKWL